MTETRSVAREKAEQPREPRALLPPVDVVEDASGIILYADLAGVPKEKLAITFEADTLTIDGTMSLDLPQEMEATHAEVSLPRYRRVFTLSRELDTEHMSAELKHGVLRLLIPKLEHVRPRRIEVRAG